MGRAVTRMRKERISLTVAYSFLRLDRRFLVGFPAD